MNRQVRSTTIRISTFFCICFIFIPELHALDITTLLKATKQQPGIKASELLVRQRSYEVKEAYAYLYPSFNAFGSLESYSSPTNLRPLPPSDPGLRGLWYTGQQLQSYSSYRDRSKRSTQTNPCRT